MCNIVSLSRAVENGHRVQMDTNKENCFIVTNKKNGKMSNFLCNNKGLYVREEYVPSCYSVYDYKDNISGTTIEGFTEREKTWILGTRISLTILS